MANMWAVMIFSIFILGQPCYAKLQHSESPQPDSFYLFFDYEQDYAQPEWVLKNQLEGFLVKLEKAKKRQRSDIGFLRTVFHKTHRKFLRSYDPSATLPETFATGTYGCLSGTAIYALILRHFGYDYEILETPSHVYLSVLLTDQKVLIESTLPLDGFISDQKKIRSITQQYEVDSRKHTSIVAISRVSRSMNDFVYGKKIDLKQLSGLQFYNMSIYDIAEDHLEEAMLNAQRSLEMYPSNRTEQLMEIVINKILQSKTLSKDQKAGILNNYIRQVKKKRLTQR